MRLFLLLLKQITRLLKKSICPIGVVTSCLAPYQDKLLIPDYIPILLQGLKEIPSH